MSAISKRSVSHLSPDCRLRCLLIGLTPLQTSARFVGLKDSCLHPTSNESYILSLKGGNDNSPEGLQVRTKTNAAQIQTHNVSQDGMTHGFVVEFASAEDRDYYITKDPSHLAFVKSIGDLVEKAVVVDFSNGVY